MCQGTAAHDNEVRILECRALVQRSAGSRLGAIHEGSTWARRCEAASANNLQPAF